jgi:hypothetical protein
MEVSMATEFFVVEGSMDIQVDGREPTGKPRDSIWIARGTDHGFTTTDEAAHVLNGYAPGGVEQIIIGLAAPAAPRALARGPRPADRRRPDAHEQQLLVGLEQLRVVKDGPPALTDTDAGCRLRHQRRFASRKEPTMATATCRTS